MGTMFLLCSKWSGGEDVEDFRRGSGSAGIDHAVCRDDCGVGATYSAVLTAWVGLGKSRMARVNGAFGVDSAHLRHHHCTANRSQPEDRAKPLLSKASRDHVQRRIRPSPRPFGLFAAE